MIVACEKKILRSIINWYCWLADKLPAVAELKTTICGNENGKKWKCKKNFRSFLGADNTINIEAYNIFWRKISSQVPNFLLCVCLSLVIRSHNYCLPDFRCRQIISSVFQGFVSAKRNFPGARYAMDSFTWHWAHLACVGCAQCQVKQRQEC